MGRTIAEAIREEGKMEGKIQGKMEGNLEAKQEALLLLLRRKFGKKVTSAVVASVRRTKELPTLDKWLGDLLDAETLDEVGIPARK